MFYITGSQPRLWWLRVISHAPACKRTEGSGWVLNIYPKITAKELC
jgi:hypothetical protein